MRKIAILTATTVLVLTGGSTAVAFAAGSDDGPTRHVEPGDDHGDDQGGRHGGIHGGHGSDD